MDESKGICCFCLSASNILLTNLFKKNEIGLTHFNKISFTLSELSNLLNDNANTNYNLCHKCSDTIDTVYQFNKACLHNVKIYLSYKKSIKVETELEQYSDDLMESSNIPEEVLVKQEIKNLPSLTCTFQDNIETEIGIGTMCKTEYQGIKNVLNQEAIGQENMEECLLSTVTENVYIRPEYGESSQESQLFNKKNIRKERKKYTCEVCGKIFKWWCDLDRHSRIHSGVKPFSCNICGKSFNVKGSMKKHKRIHTGVKPYKCVICEMAFNQSSTLQRHKLIHTGDKPYSCDICGTKFRQSGQLIGHMRYHTGEKPYGCDICSEKFPHQSNLIRHRRIHTGEKPYSCDICAKSFTQHTGLNYHKRNVHKSV